MRGYDALLAELDHCSAGCLEDDGTLTRTSWKTACLDGAAAIRELLEVVDKLPKTADGVPVVPGMVTWCWVPEGYIMEAHATMENGPVRPWTECYSTRQGAEEANNG